MTRLALILTTVLFALPALANEPDRSHLFCDQYARDAAGTGGTQRGALAGNYAGGAAGAAKNGSKGARRGILLGGAVGAATGSGWDKQLYDFYYQECISGKRLTSPWP
ncbi:hypothetical protein CSC82_11785 [Rhodobacteraceae bacterium 4F10]|nr:hypothetical protein CSC82_11785 [Rhodobacteraceae bacterium 4F10]